MTINISQLSVKYDIGEETLRDIFAELQRPGLDPREELAGPDFDANILELKDLKIGDIVKGVVRNITDFGIFVDIGLHNDGFIHKSQLANIYVSHPMDIVSIGQNISAKVIDIDLDREKVSLNSKDFVDISGISRPIQSRPKQEHKPKITESKSSDNSTGMKSNISWK